METGTPEFEIKRLGTPDLLIAQQLFLLFNEVFDIKNAVVAQSLELIKLLDSPGFICFAAIYNNEVTGGLTAYQLPMYNSKCAEMFIYDIAVKPAFQRMGAGKKLLLAIKDYCEQNGIKQMFADASEADKHALDFYRSMHGREEKVIQFTFDF